VSTYQGKSVEIFFQMVNSTTQVGVTGLLYSNLTLATRRPGGSGLTVRTILAPDLTEIGGGYYLLNLPVAETALLGTLVYRITAASASPAYGSMQVDPQPLAFLQSPTMCVVTGNIVQLGGAVADATQITFRAQHLPAQGPNQSLISSKLLTTWSDAVGNFSVALLRGATVHVEVPDCGLRGQFVVPQLSSQTLTALVPV
jgi:hypothetical protein